MGHCHRNTLLVSKQGIRPTTLLWLQSNHQVVSLEWHTSPQRESLQPSHHGITRGIFVSFACVRNDNDQQAIVQLASYNNQPSTHDAGIACSTKPSFLVLYRYPLIFSEDALQATHDSSNPVYYSTQDVDGSSTVPHVTWNTFNLKIAS